MAKTQIASKPGFLAALHQSGGSTPGALRTYGIPDSACSDDKMFRLVHQMRVRIMMLSIFIGNKIIGAIPGIHHQGVIAVARTTLS